MKAIGARTDAEFGKDSVFSTYTPAGQILKNPQAKAIVRRFIPMVAMLTKDMIADISSFSIRELVKSYGNLLRLSDAKMEKIDQALSKIPLESESSINTAKDGFNEYTCVLKGNQIACVLVAGFFTESNCISMLNEDFLGVDKNFALAQGEGITQNEFSTNWQLETAASDGFHFKEMAFDGPKGHSASYMSFYLNSPRRLDDLLTEPNVPKLYLNLETVCCLQVWLNGREIFSQASVSPEPAKFQSTLLLRKGSNHILIKVVNMDTDCVVKAYLSSTHDDFIAQLDSAVER
jgi:hypothetical protein